MNDVTNGPAPSLIERPTLDALADAASEAFASIFRAATAEHPARVILAGGNSPSVVYRRWAALDDVDWAHVAFYFGDERCVPPDSPDSNAHTFDEAFTRRLPSGSAPNIHRILGERVPTEAAQEYAATVQAIDVFDAALLGVGTDGHTASLFPGADVPDGEDAYVVERDDFTRVTLAASVFARCRRLMFFAPGESKRDVVNAIIDSSPLPAAVVARLAPSTVFATQLPSG